MFRRARIFALGGNRLPLQYEPLDPPGRRGPSELGWEIEMAADSGGELRRPVPLALGALALIGWLIVAYFWTQVSQLQTDMANDRKAAEQARALIASELQNLQKSAGSTAELQKKADAARKDLAEAISARAAAQNEISDLAKQISDAKLAISGASQEAGARTRDLQEIDARLKQGGEQLTALQGQTQAAQSQLASAQAALESARAALAATQQQNGAASADLDNLRRQSAAATSELAGVQEQIRAAREALSATQKPPDAPNQ
jgi:chromosome segregation ATPase